MAASPPIHHRVAVADLHGHHFEVTLTVPDPGECVCRTYHVASGFEESWQDFTICDNAEFPYDFTNDAGIGWGGDPLVAPGPEAPTLAELLAIILAAGGPEEVEQYDDFTDIPCEE